jgi:hypothetical protein
MGTGVGLAPRWALRNPDHIEFEGDLPRISEKFIETACSSDIYCAK